MDVLPPFGWSLGKQCLDVPYDIFENITIPEEFGANHSTFTKNRLA